MAERASMMAMAMSIWVDHSSVVLSHCILCKIPCQEILDEPNLRQIIRENTKQDEGWLGKLARNEFPREMRSIFRPVIVDSLIVHNDHDEMSLY